MLNPNTIPIKSTTPAGSPRNFSQYIPSQSMKSTNRSVTPRTKVSTMSVARLSSQDSTLTIPMTNATISQGMSSNRKVRKSSHKVYDNDNEFFQQQQQDENTPASAFKFKYQSTAKQVFSVMNVKSTTGSIYGDNEDEDGENIPVLGAKNRGILVP